MELRSLISRAKAGDVAAFTELTRRYRNMAFGYALAMLRDFHLAEDATQEAFIAGYFDLAKLQDPEAFPGWLRGIVRHQCHRILRRRHLEEVPLEDAAAVAGEGWQPERVWERAETRRQVLAAIDALPQAQREVITLYYIQEHSQREIARFLDVPVTTVNNRLHAARVKLKRRMLAMLKDTFRENALPEEFAEKVGRIVQVQGPVVEARFEPGELPQVLSELAIRGEAEQGAMTVEVAQRLENGVVRCIATRPVQGLKPGMRVVDTGKPIQEPVGGEVVERAAQLLSPAPPGADGPAEVLETGIKVIDFFCPYRKGGKVGLLGEKGIGMLVLVEELVRRVAEREHGVSLFTFVRAADVPDFQGGWTKDPLYTGGTAGAVQTFYLPSDDSAAAERAAALPFLDAATCMSRELAAMRLYPAVDPLVSSSRLLDPATVGQEHWAVANQTRQLLQRAAEIQATAPNLEDLPLEERQFVARARKLQHFFSQPFFVAEPFTGIPAKAVSREETVRSCRAILDGHYDDLPEEAFLYVGSVEEAVEKAREMGK